MAVSNISNVTNPTNNSIELVVIFQTTDRPYNYSSIYLYCYDYDTGAYISSSGNLNASYSTTYPHWSKSWNFTGLTSGTTYTFKCFINGGEQYGIQKNYTTTGTKPAPPSTPTTGVTFDSSVGGTMGGRIDNGFYVRINSVSGATSYTIDGLDETQSYIALSGTTTSSTSGIYFGGVGYGQLYYLRYTANNAYGSSGYSPYVAGLTLPDTIYITASLVGTNTARINIPTSGIRGNWTNVEVDMYNSSYSSLLQTISTTASTYDFTGLTSNTTYNFKARVTRTWNSVKVTSFNDSTWASVTTAGVPATPTQNPVWDSSAVSKGDGRVDNGFYLRINAITGATSYDVEVWDNSQTQLVFSQNVTAVSAIYFGNVGYGQNYYIRYRGRNSYGVGGYSPFGQGTSLPQSIAFTGSPLGQTAIRVNPPKPTGNFTNIIVEMWDSTKSTKLQSVTTTATYVDFTGLTMNATYCFTGRVSYTPPITGANTVYSYNDSSWLSVKTNQIPQSFAWQTSIDASGNKIANSTFSMTFAEWRAFQDRINDFRAYKGLISYGFQSSYTSIYAFEIAVTGKQFMAYHMNQTINAINDMVSTGLNPSKVKGDTVKASDLNLLKSKLNGIT